MTKFHVILGDTLEELTQFPSNAVDIVITSPPYNKAGYEGFIRTRHKSDAWGSRRNIDYSDDATLDFMNEDKYREEQVAVLNELHRIIKPKGSIFYNHKVRVAKHKGSHPLEWLLKSNLTFRQQLVWDRGSSPNISKIRFLPTTELIFWLTKTPIQPEFSRIDKSAEVIRLLPDMSNDHPAPFPVELVDYLMKHCGGDLVLDPYSGSGTTGVSALKHGKQYIGIERDANYRTQSIERLLQV